MGDGNANAMAFLSLAPGFVGSAPAPTPTAPAPAPTAPAPVPTAPVSERRPRPPRRAKTNRRARPRTPKAHDPRQEDERVLRLQDKLARAQVSAEDAQARATQLESELRDARAEVSRLTEELQHHHDHSQEEIRKAVEARMQDQRQRELTRAGTSRLDVSPTRRSYDSMSSSELQLEAGLVADTRTHVPPRRSASTRMEAGRQLRFNLEQQRTQGHRVRACPVRSPVHLDLGNNRLVGCGWASTERRLTTEWHRMECTLPTWGLTAPSNLAPVCTTQLSAEEERMLRQLEDAERAHMELELQQDLALQEGALAWHQRNRNTKHRTHR